MYQFTLTEYSIKNIFLKVLDKLNKIWYNAFVQWVEQFNGSWSSGNSTDFDSVIPSSNLGEPANIAEC